MTQSEPVYRVPLTLRRGQHVVDFHDGDKRHADGSPFYDVRVFSNLKRAERFAKELEDKGFRRA